MSLRNVALVAHVDHGKTTLVDALLRATGVFAAHQALVDRVMDSNDQERERGITILAKAASVTWRGVKINLVDTPGHADFGGEVERALAMVDGVLLLVDAAEGPLPQTRYVLSKALARDLPAVVVLNKVDRARRPRRRGARRDLPAVHRPRRRRPPHRLPGHLGRRPRGPGGRRRRHAARGRRPGAAARRDRSSTSPRPTATPTRRCRPWSPTSTRPSTSGAWPSAGSCSGTLRRGETVALLDEEFGEGQPPLEAPPEPAAWPSRASAAPRSTSCSAGDLFVVAGFPEVEIGDTIAAADDPKPLPRLIVDEPVLRMTFGVNTSPLAGKDGKFLTSRHLRERLDARGARQRLDPPGGHRLARRHRGGRPRRAAAGRADRVDAPRGLRAAGQPARGHHQARSTASATSRSSGASCDVPDEHVGTVTQALAPRKGAVTDLRPGDAGRTIVTFEAPARGLIGFRSLLLTATRGTALLHQHHAGWMPWAGELPHRTRRGDDRRPHGRRPPATRSTTSSCAGELFVGPGDICLRGHGRRRGQPAPTTWSSTRCGPRRRPTSAPTATTRPSSWPRRIEHTLETAIEWIGDDELVEVTPDAIRIRKRLLVEADRRRAAKRG